ncbi:hypothetical protein EMCRGX_G014743 [Ephydatia muelleri]
MDPSSCRRALSAWRVLLARRARSPSLATPSTVDMIDFPSTEIILVHLPRPPATPPCSPVPQEPVVRPRRSFVLPRSKTAPARLTRRQAREGPTEQAKIQSPVRSNVKITLRYLGKCGPVKRFSSNTVEVLQQHCGGNTVSLFKGGLKERDTFSIVSRRHLGMPFGLSLYVDGLIDCRVSTCCEYKHGPGRLIGPAKQAHFAVVGIEGGAPCPACEKKDMRPKAGGVSTAKQTEMARTTTTSVQIHVTDEETDHMAGEEGGQKTGGGMLQVHGGQTESHSLTGRHPSNSRTAQLRDSSANHNASSVSSTLPNVWDLPGHPSSPSPSMRGTAHPGGPATPVHPLTIRHDVASAAHSNRSHRPPPVQSRTPSHPPPPLPSLKLSPAHMPVPSHVPPLHVHPSQMTPPSPQSHPSEMTPPSPLPHDSEMTPPSPLPHDSEMTPPSPLPHHSEMTPPYSSEVPPLTAQISSQLPQEAVVPSQEVPLPLLQETLSQPQVALPLLQNLPEQETKSEVPQVQLSQTQPVQAQLLSSEVASQIQQPLPQILSPQLPPQELLISPQMPSPPLAQHALPVHAPLEGNQVLATDPTSYSILPKTSEVAAGPSEVFEEASKYDGGVNDSLLETEEEDNNSTTVYEESEEESDTEVVEREEDTADGDIESERDSHIEKKDSVEGSEECEDSEVDKKEEDGEFEEESTPSHDEACEKEAGIVTRETDETESEMEEDNEMDLLTQGSGFIGEQTSSLRPSTPLPPSSENEFETATGGRLERSDEGFEVKVVKEMSMTPTDTLSAVLNSRTSKANGSSTSVEQAVSLHSLTAHSQARNASRTSHRRISESDMQNVTGRSNADLSCLDCHDDSPSHTQKTLSSYSTSSFKSQGEATSKQEKEIKTSEAHHQVPQPIHSIEKSGNTLENGAKAIQPQPISSFSTRSLEKAVSVLLDEGETKYTLQDSQPASNLMEKSASTLQDSMSGGTSIEIPASTLLVGEMVKDTLASPQEHQPVSSYSASSFERSATTLHDGAKTNDMPPHPSKPQPASSYSASSFENQSESVTALEGEEKNDDKEDNSDKDGRSSSCSQRNNTLIATSTASHDSHSQHSSRHNPPLNTLALAGGEKHTDRIKSSPFVPSATDQGSQSLLCQAMPSNQEIKSLRMKLHSDSYANRNICHGVVRR